MKNNLKETIFHYIIDLGCDNMIDAIVYNTHTDFSKQYAYSLAVKCKLPIYSLSESRKLKDKCVDLKDEIVAKQGEN